MANGSLYKGHFEFDKLRPNTKYEVRLRAVNKFGLSDEEAVFIFKTSSRGKIEMLRSRAQSNIQLRNQTMHGAFVTALL